MRHANSHADCKSISNGHSYVYAYPDSPGHSYTYGYGYGYNHGNTVTNAYLFSRGHAWSVDSGRAGSDRSLRRLHGQRWHRCL